MKNVTFETWPLIYMPPIKNKHELLSIKSEENFCVFDLSTDHLFIFQKGKWRDKGLYGIKYYLSLQGKKYDT